MLFSAAASRELAARDIVLAGERTTAATAALALIAAAPAASVAPSGFGPVVWVLAGAVAWRIHQQVRHVDRFPLDSNGKARVDGVLPGSAEVSFPELEQPWQRQAGGR